MDTQGFIAGPLSALCIIGLVMGTASAAVITASDSTATHVHSHPSPESIIDSLAQHGVNVTEVRTALQNGDTDAVKAWLGAHRPAGSGDAGRSPPELANATRQQEIITRLGEQGVDVSGVRTSLQDGDSAAVQSWLKAYFQAHHPEKPGGSGRSTPDLTNTTLQQEIITRLGEKGVDVTDVQADLEKGDTAAVRAWLESHFQAGRPTRAEGSARSSPDLSDPVREQKILDRLSERGVNVTAAEADLQAGNTTAVQTWIETYQHSHEAGMGFHHPSPGSPWVSGTDTSN